MNRYKKQLILGGKLLFIAVLSYYLTVIGIQLIRFSGGVTVIWPVEAVLLGMMLGWLRDKPLSVLVVGETACFVGAVVVERAAHGGVVHLDFPASMSIARFIFTWLIYIKMNNYAENNKLFTSKSIIIFIFLSIASSFVTGMLFSFLLFRQIHTPLFHFVFPSGESCALGFIVLTPLLLMLSQRGWAAFSRNARPLRDAMIVLAFGLVVLAIFAQTRYALLYLVPLGFMALAYTVDLRAVAAAVLMTVVIAIGMTVSGRGPINLTPGNLAERIQVLQVFITVISATILPISALMAEYANLKDSLISARVEAEAANRAKSVFLATISHEIRTPLNGVLGMAQIMGMDELSAVQAERLGVVRRSGEALLSLLNDVLDLSKIEAGKLTFETIDFDLVEVLNGVAGGFDSLAQGKGLQLLLDVAPAEGVYRGDPLRIRQIVYNLISNALKFTASGEIRLRARYGPDGLRLAVSDTGMGIPADKLGALFSKFNQVDESTTRRFGGTGLGLSICRELADLMGGSIAVESVEGVGSTFTVLLPLARIGDRVHAGEPEVEAAKPVIATGLRVLAAEDNATNRLVLKTILDLSGVEVTLVENGAEAVTAWEGGDWDVILMDVQMPVMDGPTATMKIRAREVECGRSRTTVIALTANTMSHQVEHYLEVGMDGHLAKPIEIEALYRLLADVVLTPEPYEAGRAEVA